MSAGVDGRFGLRAGIRTFKDVVQDSSWSKRILAELYPGMAVTEWAVHSGSVYVAPLVRSHDGVRLDVASVTTLQGSLTRSFIADPTNLAAGEFWFDVEADAGEARWDASTQWDDGVTKWDEFVKLYVRLPDSSDPSDDEVEAEFRMTFGSGAETHPALGPNLISNPSFENWTAGEPDDWTLVATAGGGGGTVTITDGEDGTSDPYMGETAFQYVLTNLGAGGSRDAYQTVTLTAGRRYRFSGAYRTAEGSSAIAWPWVSDVTTGEVPTVDGRNWAATGGDTLAMMTPTNGQWRRFTLDFIAQTSGTHRFYLRAYSGSMATGTVEFDDVHVSNIERFHYYEPRISGSAVPSIITASNDIFFGGKQVGVGSLALLNHDSYFETLSPLDWINRKVILRAGAAYLPDAGGDPELCAVDDYRVAFTALIQAVGNDDTEFALDLQDIRSTYFRTAPTRTFSAADFTSVALKDEGAPRALWFGPKIGVRPIRYADDATWGNWELADCDDAPNGIFGITNVWSYVDDAGAREAAQTGTSDRRVSSGYKRTAPVFTDTTNTTSANGGCWKNVASAAWDAGFYDGTNAVAIGTDEARVEGTVMGDGADLVMLGLGSTSGTYDLSELDHGIYAPAGDGSDTYQVYESGSSVFDSAVDCWQGDRVRVDVDLDGVVTYWVNGKDTDGWELIYTSLVTASGTLYPRGEFYTDTAGFSAIGVYYAATKHHTEDLSTGRIAITADVKAIEITLENNRGSFYTGAANAEAWVNPGVYTPDELAYQFAGCAHAVAADSSFAGSYTDATSKVTLESSATGYWLCGSGDFKEIYRLLGFTQDDTTNTDTSDDGESTITDDVDEEYILRADGQGYKDDASGTYTGSASALIESGSDILRTLLVAFLKQPTTIIDEASFQNARDRAPESLSVHLNTETSIKDIMETLEFSNIANISIGGDGTVFYDVYIGTVPAGIVDLDDNDFSAFAVRWTDADVHKVVRVYYGKDPEGDAYPFKYTRNNSVETRFGRPEVKEFYTWLTAADGAQTTSFRMAELAKEPARQVVGTVRGKLLDHRVGQKVRITRDRAAASGGLMSAAIHRIISLRHNFAMGLTQFVAVPDVVTVAGVACVSACQSFCESTCQEICESSCQTECQVSTCETGCEVECETTCQTSCQDTCELACQDACELAGQCDPTCQAACQSTCETGGCQYACQYECQQTCEKSCQTTCESGCQTTCETSCQETCETSCQTSCEQGCQASCEWQCQESWQYYYN